MRVTVSRWALVALLLLVGGGCKVPPAQPGAKFIQLSDDAVHNALTATGPSQDDLSLVTPALCIHEYVALVAGHLRREHVVISFLSASLGDENSSDINSRIKAAELDLQLLKDERDAQAEEARFQDLTTRLQSGEFTLRKCDTKQGGAGEPLP